MRIICYSIFYILLHFNLSAQQFGNTSFYLVDSLEVSNIDHSDLKKLRLNLNKFHSTKNVVERSNILETIYFDNKKTFGDSYLDYSIGYLLYEINAGAHPDTLSITLMKSLAYSYNAKGYIYDGQNDLSRALECYISAKKWCKKAAFSYGLNRTFMNISLLYLKQRDFEHAMHNAYRCLEVVMAEKEPRDIGYAHSLIGHIYFAITDYENALKHYLESLKIQTKINHAVDIAHAEIMIGKVYVQLKEANKAMEHFSGAHDIYKTKKNDIHKGNLYKFTGECYLLQKKYKKAVLSYKESIKVYNDLGLKVRECTAINRLGEVYFEIGELNIAKRYYDTAHLLAKRLNHSEAISLSSYNLGTIFHKRGQTEKAHGMFNKSLQIALFSNDYIQIRSSAKQLASIEEKEGNYRQSLKYYKIYQTANDTIISHEVDRQVFQEYSKYILDGKNAKIDNLKKKNIILKKNKEILSQKTALASLDAEKKKNQIIFISGFAVLFFLLSITFYTIMKNRKKINELLASQKTEISKKHEQKITLIKEIHHRVKNNMQVLISLLSFHKNKSTSSEINSILEACQTRISSMARVHEGMYNSNNLTEINAKYYFEIFLSDLYSSYQTIQNVELEIVISEINFGSKTLIPLGLIVNEIITNSFKYAFQAERDNKLFFSLDNSVEHDDGHYVLTIGDNGVGLPKDFNPENSESLGMELVQIFTEQLDGTIEHIKRPGTFYRILFRSQDD
ncbi:MAG: hypothetical protein COA38_18670 [Fluviicola sp.]|nr:MAG: hypothetical protein COA38_18670 [Fluviicola sp.]